MAEKIVSPGVFTRERDLSFLPAAIGEIGAAIIGPTVKGPALVPTVVNSYGEFQAKFGDSFRASGSDMPESGDSYYQYLTSHTAEHYLKHAQQTKKEDPSLAEKLDQLGQCRFMDQSEFEDGIGALKGKKIVIVGCGAQGLNQGLNMRDSGLDISYALRQGAIDQKRTSYQNAVDHNFNVGRQKPLLCR